MPFSRPTITEILDQIKSDINSKLPGTDARLRRSVLNVIAYILSGATHGLYGKIDWDFKQCFPDTAEVEFLERWGALKGVTRLAASKASGNVEATGTNGTVIPEDTELQRSDGVVFLTTEEATISGGTATVAVEAEEAGLDGETEPSSTLTFVSPIAGIDTEVTVDEDGLTGGSDIETDDDYRARVVYAYRNPAQGGSESDYIQWAMQNPGVTRAWVYPEELGDGTVTVRFMMDDTYDDGIPEAGDVTTVQAYIDERRPVAADVTVVAPTAVPLNFTINLEQGDTTAIRAAVQAELEDLIRRDAEPGGTIYLSRINEAISLATGEFDHILTVPAANVTHTTGQIATMGTITWT